VDIEDLRTFVEVADAGGVTPAARRLGVSKSMVSRRLVRLEAELGAQLLSRTTRGAALTEAGITFRDHAVKACAEIDLAKETILPTGELRGRLRIAAPLSFGPTHFASIIAKLAMNNPDLHVSTCYTDRLVDLIAEGFDCGIRVGYLADSSLVARRVGPLYAKFVASPDYIAKHGSPRTPEEFVTHEAVMQGTESWPVVVDGKVVMMKPQGRFKGDNGVALVAAALAGLGLAALPVDLISEHLETGALVPVMPDYALPEIAIYVVRPPGQHPSRKIKILTEMLIECFKDHTTS
jgi:DNA-binding transcriptional LysR family regulator